MSKQQRCAFFPFPSFCCRCYKSGHQSTVLQQQFTTFYMFCIPTQPSSRTLWQVALSQRGLSEVQNGYAFGMLPGYGLPNRLFSKSAPSGSLSKALELENSPSRRPCLIIRGVNFTFHSSWYPTSQITHRTKLGVSWCFGALVSNVSYHFK
jgi:hypothetical protein